MAYKTFLNGYPLPASELNTYFMGQVVATFANASERSAAITSPVEGQLTYLEDANAYYTYTGSAWTLLNTGDVAGKNKIINGAFDFWQRGTSFSTAGAFTADRWTFAGGTSNTLTQQTFTPGAAPVAGYEGTYFARYTLTTAGDFNVSQPVENVRTLAGQTVTLSFWTKTSSASSIDNIYLIQDFGSGGSTIVVTSVTGLATTTGWTRHTYTATLPSIAGKTIGTNHKLTVRLDINEAFTGTWDIWGVQLEAGSVATPFSRAAGTYAGELEACQRYARRYNTLGQIAVSMSSGDAALTVHYPPMRTTPTASYGMTNANYGTGWTFVKMGIAAYSKTGTVTLSAVPAVDNTSIAFTGATWSGTVNGFQDLGSGWLLLESEL
jgi:hypothetical protein